jgi:predicted ABC-type ATPase
MKTSFQLRAATRLLADWWSNLGPEGQAQYLKDHPNSEKAKEAREQQKKTEQEAPQPATKPGIDEKPKQKPLAPGKPLAEFFKQYDDPNITADKIYEKLKPEDAKEIKDKTKEAMQLPPSDELYSTGKGKNDYTPERRALHDKIIKSVITADAIKAATPKAGEKPTFIVLGGRGGSGKSGFTNGTINEFDSSKFLLLDPDHIKGMLEPPYEGWNANQVHEESSYVFDKVMDAARKMGLNIISDATLKSDKIGGVMEDMIKQGYDIEGHYMFLPRQKAAQRACGRYLKDGPQNRGRLVPPEVILGNTKNEENFDKLKKYFKRFSAYNNDVAKGQPPQLIDHSDYHKDRQMSEKDNTATPERKPEKQAASMSPRRRYGADSWENDAFLDQNPARMEKVLGESFQTLKDLGVPADRVQNPEARKRYQAYLAKK